MNALTVFVTYAPGFYTRTEALKLAIASGKDAAKVLARQAGVKTTGKFSYRHVTRSEIPSSIPTDGVTVLRFSFETKGSPR